MHIDTLLIRQANRCDLPKVLSLYRDLAAAYDDKHEDAVPVDMIWEMLKNDQRQQLLVAEVKGIIIGTLTVIIIPNIGHGCRPWAAVENVVVEEACRGMGIGTRLMEGATKLCRDFGCYKIVLSSNLSRHEAHAFYRRLGWQQTHTGFSINLTLPYNHNAL